MKKSNMVHKSGKRKRAVARATIKDGKGKVKINGVLLSNFGNDISRLRIQEPLILSGDVTKKIEVIVSVKGGGVNGQADAIRLAAKQAGYSTREIFTVETGFEWGELALAADSMSLFADKKLIDFNQLWYA